MTSPKPLDGKDPRCEGRAHDSPGGLVFADECLDCRRRTTPPEGMWQPFMTPQPAPCDWRVKP